jgi:hypothetical protein
MGSFCRGPVQAAFPKAKPLHTDTKASSHSELSSVWQPGRETRPWGLISLVGPLRVGDAMPAPCSCPGAPRIDSVSPDHVDLHQWTPAFWGLQPVGLAWLSIRTGARRHFYPAHHSCHTVQSQTEFSQDGELSRAASRAQTLAHGKLQAKD